MIWYSKSSLQYNRDLSFVLHIMDNKQIDTLLNKMVSENVTSEDERRVIAFIHEYNAGGDSGLTEEDFQVAETEMWKSIGHRIQPKVKKVAIWKFAIAASVAIVLFGSGLFYYRHLEKTSPGTAYANDIAAGKNTATLTLANGRKIVLSAAVSGALAFEQGVRISKTSDGEITYEIKEPGKGNHPGMNTLSTSLGETYRVKLPDGSVVWLNAASSLKYPASFLNSKIREVILEGEAFFEVAKDEMHPFKVKTKEQNVTVLGTHFNIKAYDEEKAIVTTLVEGSVRIDFQAVAWNNKGKVFYKDEVMLVPGQQSLLKGETVNLSKANLEENVAWKEGNFIFTDDGIEPVMRNIARWYNIQVIYKGDIPTGAFSGNVSRTKNISQVLQALESTKLVHFKIEGRKVYVTK